MHVCDQAQPCKLPVTRIKSRKEGQEARLPYKTRGAARVLSHLILSRPGVPLLSCGRQDTRTEASKSRDGTRSPIASSVAESKFDPGQPEPQTSLLLS